MAIDYQYYEFRAFENLVKLAQLWEGEEELPQIHALMEEIRQEQELIRTRKFRVAVVGEFKRGKSSFINALLGREILPVDALPTTATLNRITYGALPRAYLRYKDEKVEEVEIGELSRYVTKLTQESEDAASRIEEAVVEYPSIFCQGHVDLIDTPGMNDDMEMNAVTLSQLEHIDLAIVTLSPGSPFSDTESRFMARILESDEICRVIVAVTKIDEVRGEERRKKLLAYLAQRIPEKTIGVLEETCESGDPILEKAHRLLQDLPIFGVSSLDALEARRHNDEELFAQSGFAELSDRLPQLILSSQNNSAVLRAVSTVRKITGGYEGWLSRIQGDCRKKQDEIREERKAFAGTCYSLAERGSLESLKRALWKEIDIFSSVQEETGKEFIRCLSSISVLDSGLIEKALKKQAEKSAEEFNRKAGQRLYPSLRNQMSEGLLDWHRNILGQILCSATLQQKGREKARDVAEELAAQPPFSARLPQIPFFFRESPVPGRERLLAPDLITDIQRAVKHSVQGWCADRKEETEVVLNRAHESMSEALERLVVTLYEEDNQRIAQWEARGQRLGSPELLEKLRQLSKDSQNLEVDFIKEL